MKIESQKARDTTLLAALVEMPAELLAKRLAKPQTEFHTKRLWAISLPAPDGGGRVEL